MIPDKIKQRLLGLVGVCIILSAFIPILLEEPDTYLTVSPPLVPSPPQVSMPTKLFESMASEGAQWTDLILREREAYRSELAIRSNSAANDEVTKAPSGSDHSDQAQRFLPESALPLAFLRDRPLLMKSEEEKNLDLPEQNAVAPYALPRAWTLRLDESDELNRLLGFQKNLRSAQIRSYLVPQDVVSSEGKPRYTLYVGPFLRYSDAERLLSKLRSDFPQTQPAIEVYLPELSNFPQPPTDSNES